MTSDNRYLYLPMLAKLCENPFESDEYTYEPKLDGIRAVAYIRDGRCTLINRAGNDVTSKFPEVHIETTTDCVLDGELACLNDKGIPDFQLMQTRMNRIKDVVKLSELNPAKYFAFDCLEVDGKKLTNQPLYIRRVILTSVLVLSDFVKQNEVWQSGAIDRLNSLSEIGHEGIIAKRTRSTYKEGKRTDDWLKFKCRKSDTVIVGGLSVGFGKREGTFGALICGKFDNEGNLMFCGEVGTGFSDLDLAALTSIFTSEEVDYCPFTNNLPRTTLAMMWVRPIYKVNVTYLEITDHGIMRHAAFKELL